MKVVFFVSIPHFNPSDGKGKIRHSTKTQSGKEEENNISPLGNFKCDRTKCSNRFHSPEKVDPILLFLFYLTDYRLICGFCLSFFYLFSCCRFLGDDDGVVVLPVEDEDDVVVGAVGLLRGRGDPLGLGAAQQTHLATLFNVL